jgi:hypothetical protein
MTHHGPDSGEATTFPLIVFFATPRRGYIQMALFPGTPKGSPKLSRFGLPGLWAFITSRPELGSGRTLNQTCSSRRELSNVVLHSCCRRREEVDSQLFVVVSHFCCKRREEVDSRLFVVRSQTASLTSGPSFAHNLGCRCPNGQCEASLDIYTSRPFQ